MSALHKRLTSIGMMKTEVAVEEKVETPATEARPPAAFRRVQGRSGGGAITDIRAPGRHVKTLGSF